MSDLGRLGSCESFCDSRQFIATEQVQENGRRSVNQVNNRSKLSSVSLCASEFTTSTLLVSCDDDL